MWDSLSFRLLAGLKGVVLNGPLPVSITPVVVTGTLRDGHAWGPGPAHQLDRGSRAQAQGVAGPYLCGTQVPWPAPEGPPGKQAASFPSCHLEAQQLPLPPPLPIGALNGARKTMLPYARQREEGRREVARGGRGRQTRQGGRGRERERGGEGGSGNWVQRFQVSFGPGRDRCPACRTSMNAMKLKKAMVAAKLSSVTLDHVIWGQGSRSL